MQNSTLPLNRSLGKMDLLSATGWTYAMMEDRLCRVLMSDRMEEKSWWYGCVCSFDRVTDLPAGSVSVKGGLGGHYSFLVQSQ